MFDGGREIFSNTALVLAVWLRDNTGMKPD